MQGFLARFRDAVRFLETSEDLVVVSHYDADGLTSGAIASTILDRMGKEHEVVPVKKLDESTVKDVANKGSAFWFVDLGSGQLDVIQEHVGSDYLICDHHETVSGIDAAGVHLNAHQLGWDGSSEISGAGMTYLVGKTVSDKNIDLSAIAVVGAVGDMQDSTGALVGKNREIVRDGQSSGYLGVFRDLRLFGRYTRPLIQFLSYSSDPVIPGLTGNDSGCARFLSDIGIPVKKGDKWLSYMDLPSDDRKRLVSGLYVYALSNGVDEGTIKTMFGEVYELVKESPDSYTRDAKDFATILNACGRHGEMEVGIQVAKGDRGEYYDRAVNILQKHKRTIHDAIRWALSNDIDSFDSMYVLDGRGKIEDSIIGIVAGMLYNAGAVPRDKPIIALANDEDGNIKISGRANWALVKKGIHLGNAMKELASEFGGAGGGHNIAAGATVSKDKKDEFLERLSKKLGEQIS